jgi:methionyl aminopeptidase
MNLKNLIKTKEQIENMKIGGHILYEILEELKEFTSAGVSTKEIDDEFGRLCEVNGVKSAFKNYKGFPAFMCVNINNGVVHGIGRSDEYVEDGDLVKLDVGIVYKGLITDMSETIYLGDDEKILEFLNTVNLSRDNAIHNVKQGNTVADISKGIQETIERKGYSVVRELIGHGVGVKLHEDPEIPGYITSAGREIPLLSGMTLAIESIVNMGKREVIFMDDGWLCNTKDNSLSAISEHTVLVTDVGYEILTQ